MVLLKFLTAMDRVEPDGKLLRVSFTIQTRGDL